MDECWSSYSSKVFETIKINITSLFPLDVWFLWKSLTGSSMTFRFNLILVSFTVYHSIWVRCVFTRPTHCVTNLDRLCALQFNWTTTTHTWLADFWRSTMRTTPKKSETLSLRTGVVVRQVRSDRSCAPMDQATCADFPASLRKVIWRPGSGLGQLRFGAKGNPLVFSGFTRALKVYNWNIS